ncbi:MAG: RNA polymerase sigma factor [Lachnospiraceae bacterium]
MQEFQELYQEYNRIIYKFLLKLTHYNEDLADELTQETFFQVYLSLPRYKGKSKMITWICSIAKNVCYRYYYKNPIAFHLDAVDEIPGSDQEDLQSLVEQKETLRRVLSEIMALKKKYRDIIIYRLVFEMPFAEIAAIKGITENSAKVIFHRGKDMVRKRLEGFDNG